MTPSAGRGAPNWSVVDAASPLGAGKEADALTGVTGSTVTLLAAEAVVEIALAAERQAYLDHCTDVCDQQGRRLVTGGGYRPAREYETPAGRIVVRVPRVRDGRRSAGWRPALLDGPLLEWPAEAYLHALAAETAPYALPAAVRAAWPAAKARWAAAAESGPATDTVDVAADDATYRATVRRTGGAPAQLLGMEVLPVEEEQEEEVLGVDPPPEAATEPAPRRRRLVRPLAVAAALAVGIAFLPGSQPQRPSPRVETILSELRAEAAAATAEPEPADAPAGTVATAAVDNPNAGAPPAVFQVPERGFTPLGVVQIPAIGLVAEYSSGVHDEVLVRGPGHWPGTPLPGQPGNAVLSGHRTTFTAPFADLDKLVVGNHIGVTLGRHPEVVYQVTETLVVPEAEYVDAVIAQPAEPGVRQITLFACHPEGWRTHRIIVRAQVTDPSSAPPNGASDQGVVPASSA